MKSLLSCILQVHLLLISWGCYSQISLAESNFEYSHPWENRLHNFSSIDFRDFSDHLSAVEGTPEWLTIGGPVSTSLEVKLVDDFSTLDETLDINSSIALTAKYMNSAATGSATFNTMNYFKTDERSISIVIKLSSDFGKFGYRSAKLAKSYDDLLKNGRFEEFVRSCGTHYVSHTDNVVRAIAIINIHNLDHTTKRKLVQDYRGKVEGSYKGFSGSIEANRNLQHLINTARNVSSIETTFHAIGAGGPPALSTFIANVNKNDVNELLKGLADFAQTGTRENAAPVKYYLMPYYVHGLRFEKKYGYDYNYLQTLAEMLTKISTSTAELKKIIGKRTLYDAYYNEMLQHYNQSYLIYQNLVTRCIENGECATKNPEIRSIIWPYNMSIDEDLIINPTYSALAGTKSEDILTSVTVRLQGYLLFPEYFNRIEFFYIDEAGQKIFPDNFVAGEQIVLEDISIYGNVNAKKYLAQIDRKLERFDFNDKSQVSRTNENVSRAKAILEEINRREYYLRTYSTDGFSSTTYIGKLNTSNISIIQNRVTP